MSDITKPTQVRMPQPQPQRSEPVIHERERPEPPQRRDVVNLERLRDTIEADMHEVTGPKPAIFTPVRPQGKTAVQAIAIAVTRLTWREAEDMGSAIQVKMKDGMSLTAAIQSWAAEWEKFEEHK